MKKVNEVGHHMQNQIYFTKIDELNTGLQCESNLTTLQTAEFAIF